MAKKCDSLKFANVDLFYSRLEFGSATHQENDLVEAATRIVQFLSEWPSSRMVTGFRRDALLSHGAISDG